MLWCYDVIQVVQVAQVVGPSSCSSVAVAVAPMLILDWYIFGNSCLVNYWPTKPTIGQMEFFGQVLSLTHNLVKTLGLSSGGGYIL